MAVVSIECDAVQVMCDPIFVVRSCEHWWNVQKIDDEVWSQSGI
jgi:hypothetical protein